jgi:hypothetical protein
MNKSGQMVFIAALIGLLAFITFFIALPVLLQFIAFGKSQITQPFVMMVLDFFPFMLFLMIAFFILKLARSG